jgi:dephospho-CoA kinase
MLKIAVTGCIASGKSTLLNAISNRNIPIFDCDTTIRQLYCRENIVREILTQFPEIFVNGVFEKNILKNAINGCVQVRKKLQSILYPYLYKEMEKFFTHHRRRNTPLVFIEIPLVFENRTLNKYDGVVIVKSPIFKRRQNFIKRNNDKTLWQIAQQNQWPDEKKIGFPTKTKKLEFFLHSTKFQNIETDKLLNNIYSNIW